MIDANTKPVIYLRPFIVQLVEKSVDARHREREDNPLVFRRYAETLLRSLNTLNKN